MLRTAGRVATAFLSASALVALGTVPASADVVVPPGTLTPPDSGSFLYLHGEAGDYIVGPTEELYTYQDAQISASANYDGGVSGSVTSTDGSHWWYLDFAAPNGEPLTVGSYTGAVRFPFQEAHQAGLALYGDGRGCNTLTGQFDVTEAQYNPDGSPVVFDVTFEQHCEGGEAAAFGRFRYESDGPVATDTTPPTVHASDMTVQARDANGAEVHYYSVSATDDWDPQPTVTCDPASGSLLPIGDTVVTCTATDFAGNTSEPTSFTVHVLPPLEAVLAVSSGTVDASGTVTLRGTLTCSREATNGSFTGDITQTVARRAVIYGHIYVTSTCSPGGTPWEATFASGNGRFAPGSASFNLYGTVCDFECEDISAVGQVRLKGSR